MNEELLGHIGACIGRKAASRGNWSATCLKNLVFEDIALGYFKALTKRMGIKEWSCGLIPLLGRAPKA
jgi:hypothetical protein